MMTAAAAAVVLAACGGTPERDDAVDPTLVDRVADVLAGQYTNHAQWQTESERPDSGPVVLEISRIPDAGMDRVALRMVQSRPESPARAFVVELAPDTRPQRLVGRFRPEAPGSRWCPLDVTVRNDGFVARTDAATCRFGGDDGHGLIKEFAHDGHRLVIGDRIVAGTGDRPVGDDRVLHFDRVYRFGGWAGVQESEDNWRIAGEIDLASDGRVIEPTDAAGMDLGIHLRLGAYRWSEDAPLVLRLTASNAESGELLGQAWADMDARSIGLALPDVQVGLTRSD